jgi:predicted nucleic acid-binding protein
MSKAEAFFDTNILLYLLSEDAIKADCAEQLMTHQGVISVQVLNEFTSVASRKLHMNYDEIEDFLNTIHTIVSVQSLTVETHKLGLHIAKRYQFSFYDSLIVATALQAGCITLYTEDLQNNQILEEQLTVINPFIQ